MFASDLRRAPFSASAMLVLLSACGGSAAGTDAAAADTGVHVEPSPGAAGGTCDGTTRCAAGTECNGMRCVACGALGELPCASGCREGMPRYGVCFSDTAAGGTLGGFCRLEDCDPGTCTVPDGADFVCFACGQAAGQPCCPVTGCAAPLACTGDVCH